MRPCIFGHAFALFAIFLASVSWGQALPEDEELKRRIEEKLASSWRITGYTEVASRHNEDPISPAIAIRFEATVQPVGQLYLPYGTTLGPFEVLIESVSPDTQRRLYGTFDLNYSAGSWNGETEIENPTDELGKSIDLFTEPVLVLGSPGYKSAAERIANDKLKEVSTKLSVELAAIRSKHESSMAQLLVEHSTALRALEDKHLAEIDSIRQEHMTVLERIAKRHREDLSSRFDRHRDSLSKTLEANAEELAEVRANHATELAALETGFEARLNNARNLAKVSQEVLSLQETVIERRTEMLDNESWLNQLDSQLAVTRRQQVGLLMGDWTGVANCEDNDPSFSFSASLKEYAGGNLAGEVTVLNESSSRFASTVGTPLPALLSVTSSLNAKPLNLKLLTRVTGGPRKRLFFDLQLQDDGTLTGQSGDNAECQITLSK